MDLLLEPKKKVANTFDYANRAGARYIVFVAPSEWEKGTVRVKDLRLGEDDPGRGETDRRGAGGSRKGPRGVDAWALARGVFRGRVRDDDAERTSHRAPRRTTRTRRDNYTFEGTFELG